MDEATALRVVSAKERRRPTENVAPLEVWCVQGPIRTVEVAAAAGVSLPTVVKLRKLDPAEISRMSLDRIQRVALALGCAPAELVPWLASSPRSGLLWDRGLKVFRRVPEKKS